MSETPRTDAAVRECDGKWSYVLRDCSRELERELASAKETIKCLKKAGDWAAYTLDLEDHRAAVNAWENAKQSITD